MHITLWSVKCVSVCICFSRPPQEWLLIELASSVGIPGSHGVLFPHPPFPHLPDTPSPPSPFRPHHVIVGWLCSMPGHNMLAVGFSGFRSPHAHQALLIPSCFSQPVAAGSWCINPWPPRSGRHAPEDVPHRLVSSPPGWCGTLIACRGNLLEYTDVRACLLFPCPPPPNKVPALEFLVSHSAWSEVLVIQVCLTLCHPVDCSLPGSSVHENFQARILKWITIPFSRGSSWPRDRTYVSRITDRLFTIWVTRAA